ncbi:hypothetical protein [Caminibacter pacificus]|uniref:Uncharacterized protein n=1 Tax=Caminibacter pacificus TaxID=1424653 RepID=A0AAJ4RCM8_9BACT|nr:hypothetical protein [Caminibacter pacificus]QCI27925.1 hypothetical protein C6V80_02760 [Caminibacter pacificus]ROR39897.1 hypothetical protein EDC58_0876 [Caminibacter pacificus]
MKKFLLFTMLMSTLLFAKDIVYIHAYATYPCPSGKDLKGKGEYLIPNNTKGVVLQWNKKYTKKGSIFAQADMWVESKVKILNGPLKGKILMIPHIYLFLKK